MIRVGILLLAAITLHSWPVSAQQRWKAEKLEDPGIYLEATRENRPAAPSGIPHMLTAQGPQGANVAQAWYAQPTSRYRHGVLGDAIEGGMLVVRMSNGRTLRYQLPETRVFEDIAPRIGDLDGNGSMEIVTIVSSLSAGASVTVFGISGSALAIKASTGFIGQANRWLNIAAISNFTGGRLPEIAFVATPHIGGRLALLKYVPNGFLTFAASSGFSNHVIGSPELRLSAVADVNEDGRADLALPSQDRRRLRIMTLEGGNFTEIGAADLPAAIDKAIAATGRGKKTVFLVGTEDGAYYSISR